MTAPAFHTTRWSLIARAVHDDRAIARKALGELCEQYWQALYAWLRRRGSDEHQAQDLIQGFCARLIENGGLQGADANVGSFRHYLLGALRHFVDNEARHQNAQKRGGSVATWSFDDAEARYVAEPADLASPERLFERRWAMSVLDRAMARLREEYAAKNRTALLAALEPALLGDAATQPHASIAADLGSSEGAVKVALHRLRTRLRELVRDEVAQTLLDPGEVDEELRLLFAALRS